MKIDPKIKAELVNAARAALATPEEQSFWREVEKRMEIRDEARKELIKPRPNRSTT